MTIWKLEACIKLLGEAAFQKRALLTPSSLTPSSLSLSIPLWCSWSQDESLDSKVNTGLSFSLLGVLANSVASWWCELPANSLCCGTTAISIWLWLPQRCCQPALFCTVLEMGDK